MEDITVQEPKQESLYWDEEQYRLLFERTPQPMWVHDEETLAFLAVNGAAMHHYGYSLDDFLRMTLKDVRPLDQIPKLLKALNAQWGRLVHSCGVWKHRKKDSIGATLDIQRRRVGGTIATCSFKNPNGEKKAQEIHED